jgi:hypothetical protein
MTYSVSADCPVARGWGRVPLRRSLVSFLNSAGLRSPEATIFSSWRPGAQEDRHRYRRPFLQGFAAGRVLMHASRNFSM